MRGGVLADFRPSFPKTEEERLRRRAERGGPVTGRLPSFRQQRKLTQEQLAFDAEIVLTYIADLRFPVD
jgi:hypothetical protein